MGAIGHAVGQAAEDVQGRAQAQLADHVVTGNLKASIHVEGPEVAGMGVEAKVATGGESSEYAIFQHEGTSRGVPATKFIEAPLIGMAPVYRAYIEQAMRSAY